MHKTNRYVVSRYVDRPLLVDSLKFDMRIYVAVTSFRPLTVYVFRDGLARFATEKYTNDPDSHKSRFQHLTNYSVNKFSENFVANDDVDSDTGTKQSLRALMKRLNANGVDVEMMWSRIHDLIIKTCVSIQSEVNGAVKSKVPRPNCLFQLFGFDVLVDENLRPWLVEVNFSPSLNTDAEIDLDIKGPMIADLLNLAGVRARPKKEMGTKTAATKTTNRRRSDDSMLRRFVQTDSRSGGFYRIFPNPHSFSYLKYFQDEQKDSKSMGMMMGDVIDTKDENEMMAEYLYDRASTGGSEKESETIRRVRQKKYVQKLKALDNGCMGLPFNRVWFDKEVSD